MKLNIKYVVVQALNVYGGAWLLIAFIKQICTKRNVFQKYNFLYQKKILINEVIIIFVGCPKNKHFSPLIDLSPNFGPKPLFPQNRSN